MLRSEPVTGELARWVTEVVQAFIRTSPDNTLQDASNERAWGDPLVGFARGDDPLFETLKQAVGPFHWTPLEAFSQVYPVASAAEASVGPEELTVIAWVLPQTEATRADNRQEETYPAERWARSRVFGEQANDALRRHMVGMLEEAGYQAVAPVLAPGWATLPSEQYMVASTWSERHIAYACGLGTFGLCDGLITPLGKAVRLGSVVARIPITPTQRPYQEHHAYCLFYRYGTCGKCITRCPAGALSGAGHDKTRCREHTSVAVAEFVRARYGFEGYGCGLCQTGVPCEARIPVRQDG